jgi:hypothetical protein
MSLPLIAISGHDARDPMEGVRCDGHATSSIEGWLAATGQQTKE